MSPDRTPGTVGVVVPHFDDPRRLDLVLTGLELQRLPKGVTLDVVVADDGSPTRPDPGPRPYPVRVVAQPDRGFRAAAARNLGAAATDAEFLVFLDADTVPEPGYVGALLAAVAPATSSDPPADLVVGRRRHADLSRFGPTELRAWFAGGPAPAEFEEPAWLRDAYRRTENLRTAGPDAYRFVISAVLGVRRETFDVVGGFEEEFVGYGGEDWEFAHRCWNSGAEFRHVPTAVAWHDGPDFAGRDLDARRARNQEGLTLARFVPDPLARGTGLVWDVPDVVVTLDDTGADPADVVACVADLLRGTDAAVWLFEGGAADRLRDPRVHVGPVPADLLRRSRFLAEVDTPVRLVGAGLRDLTDLVDRGPVSVGEHLRVHRTRDLARAGLGRADRAEACPAPAGVSARPARDTDLQREWGHAEHRRQDALTGRCGPRPG
ncbi:glycosyltransferase [Kineococcus gynurae]|uniref:Glycosyltransferase n=1 Tax=Kineococcus gynurae TaxID=452979 RepID=A0ABV5LNC5_9ACTN